MGSPGTAAIVVGAAGGIGSAIAIRFAQAGAKVACVDRVAPDAVAQRIADAGGAAVAMACDITRPDETQRVADQGRCAVGTGRPAGGRRFYRDLNSRPVSDIEEEERMPEVYIYVAEGRTVEQKRTVAREVSDVLIRNFDVPPEAVVVQFVESPKDSKARGGVLFSDAAPPPKAG